MRLAHPPDLNGRESNMSSFGGLFNTDSVTSCFLDNSTLLSPNPDPTPCRKLVAQLARVSKPYNIQATLREYCAMENPSRTT
jgi:hypothetical protein